MGCLKFRVRSKCTALLCSFLKHWRFSWASSASVGHIQPPIRFSAQRKWLQERHFRHPKVFLQRHPQQTFTYDWRIYSSMHCWAKIWVGPYLMGCAAVEKHPNGTTLHQISFSNCSPQLLYIAARCSTKQCGCRKHWLECKRACDNCQDGDCDSAEDHGYAA